LGVTLANPQAYVQQYGATLLDAVTLVQQARAAGVVEDIVNRIYFYILQKKQNSSFVLILVTTCW